MLKRSHPHRSFVRFAALTLVVVLGVILWGAFVRATGSGAGCGAHWPLCNGEVVPQDAGSKTWVEFTHRLTSGVSLLMVVGMAFWARRAFAVGTAVRRYAGWSVFFMFTEAGVGAALVLLRLVEGDASAARAAVLAAHLINTLFLLASIVLTWFFARLEGATSSASFMAPEDRTPGYVLLLLWGLVGAAGAVTALGDTLFPSRTLVEGFAADADPLSHFLVRLRVFHPILALSAALSTYLFGFYRRSRPVAADGDEALRAGRLVFTLLATQIMLGFLNLALLAPTWSQLVHLLLADLLWLSIIVWLAQRSVPLSSVSVQTLSTD